MYRDVRITSFSIKYAVKGYALHARSMLFQQNFQTHFWLRFENFFINQKQEISSIKTINVIQENLSLIY